MNMRQGMTRLWSVCGARFLVPGAILLAGCASGVGQASSGSPGAATPTPAPIPAATNHAPAASDPAIAAPQAAPSPSAGAEGEMIAGDSTPAPKVEASPSPTPHGPRNTYTQIHTTEKVVALTFDDGPHATNTLRLLKLLKERGVKATFFLVGENVEEYPDIVRQIAADGHELANHSWSHPSYLKLSSQAAHSQTERTQAAIEKIVGYRPKMFRPPYGATNATIKAWTEADFGMKTILWSVDPLDWKRPGPSVVAQRIISGAGPGGIILAHDIHEPTIDAMPKAIDSLLAAGYRFATVSELIALE